MPKQPSDSLPATFVASDNQEGLSGILSAVLMQTQVIQTADTATDEKSNNLMAAALVIIALLATQLKNEQGQWQWFAIAAILVLVCVVGLVVFLTRGRVYYGTVVNLQEHKEYFGMDSELLLVQLAEDAQDANRHNRRILLDKQRLFSVAVGVFLFGFWLGLMALVLSA